MTNYQFMSDIASSYLMPERDLDEPEASRHADDEEFEREEAYQDELRDVLMGKGDFWRYFNDEALFLANAVKKAMMLPCADEALRWRIVQAELNRHADEYARWVVWGGK